VYSKPKWFFKSRFVKCEDSKDNFSKNLISDFNNFRIKQSNQNDFICRFSLFVESKIYILGHDDGLNLSKGYLNSFELDEGNALVWFCMIHTKNMAKSCSFHLSFIIWFYAWMMNLYRINYMIAFDFRNWQDFIYLGSYSVYGYVYMRFKERVWKYP